MLLKTTTCFAGEKSFLRKFWIIIISLMLVSIQIFAQNGWTKKGNLTPLRATASASVIENKIYIIGGNTGSPNFYDLAVTEVYNPLTNTSEVKAPIPTARGWLSTSVVNGIIYAIGGGYQAMDKTEAYDPVTNTWTIRANMLSSRKATHAGVVNGIIYIIGGGNGARNCEAYDPIMNTWTSKTNRPVVGGEVALTVFNGLIYTFGGNDANFNPYSNVYVYNPQTGTWTQKQNMPTARFGCESYLVDGKIYVIGGGQTSYSALAIVEVYDPINDSWTNLQNMPQNLTWFASAVVDNKIYVISGTPDWATGDGAIWEFDPFLNIPVELTSFTATPIGKEVTLNWTTATEMNNQGFEVQRKFGSSDFATIGSVKGHGTTTSPNQYSYVDKLVDPGRYYYRLKQIDYGGTFEFSNEIEVEVRILDKFTLEQNYPNPFNPSTKISWQSPESSRQVLKVFDVLGNEIVTLINKEMEAGYHSIDFNGSELPSGVYFYQLQAGSFVEMKKMILLR